MGVFRRRERNSIGYGVQNDNYRRGFGRNSFGQRRGFWRRGYHDGYSNSYGYGNSYGSGYSRYGNSYRSGYGSYNNGYSSGYDDYGSGYSRRHYGGRRMSFWRRQEGYGSHYGSQDDDSGSKTSKLLAAITEKTAQVKEKRAARLIPQAQSSNVVYEASEAKGGIFVLALW